MRMAQDRNFMVIAIISAFVAASSWWGPVGRVSHAALRQFKNEGAKTSEPLMSLARAAADEPSGLYQPDGQLMLLSRGGEHKLSSTLTGATVQFSAANYSAGEGDQRVTLSITRSGDTSSPATVVLATSDLAGAQNCNAITGIASSRCDYETRIGAVKFAAGETSKSASVAIIDDAYLEGPETFTVSLTNPTGATLGSPANATVTIADNDAANGVSPIVTASFFVPVHYLDFLNREPDPSGLNFWLNQITSCGVDQQCTEVKRINVSASFYLSIEFQQSGYLVERLYKAAYGDAIGASTYQGAHQLSVPIVRLNEFLSDTQEIGQGVIVNQGNWQQQLEDNKQSFTSEFVQRVRFTTALPTSLTPAQYVDKLNINAGNPLSSGERNQLVDDLTTSAKTRAQVLRTIAEHQNLVNAEFNRAFVLMQYFGYLRRNPDDPQDTDYTGYDFWLTKLNAFNGNFVNAEMVKAFIASAEYGNRFGAAATPPPPPPSLTPEQRLAALEAVRAEFELLKNGPDQNTVNQELLNFIRSRPEFAEAGLSTDSCVWAKYIDGVGLIIANNRDPDLLSSPGPAPGPVVARSLSANLQPENLPESPKTRLYFALGPLFRNPVPDISNWLAAENYVPVSEAATVENLRHVGGDGVFYFGGHGGTFETSSGNAYALATAELPNPTRDKQLETDLIPNPPASGLTRNRLVYFEAVSDVKNGKELVGVYYGFTSQFIRDYWGRFSPGSLVYIDSCSSGSPGAFGIRDAVKEKGASVYAGWTDTVHGPVMFEASRFVFDRLLGANKIYPEGDGFKQRPFDYLSVAVDLPLHGLGHDQASGANLAFTAFPTNGNSQTLLAPSIWFMEVDSYFNVLTIQGEFGEDPGTSNRKVTVGGQEIHVITWANNQIICDLPVSGLGSSGEVIVTVRQQKSNTAYLTEWEGDFTHTVTGQGSLKQTATYHIRIRADIRVVRNHIHEVPNLIADRAIVATEDSGYSYECSGSFTETLPGPPPQACTEKWFGAGSLPRLPFLQTGTGILAIGFVNNTKLTLQLSVKAGAARLVNFGCTPPGGSSDTPDSLFSPQVGNEGTFFANLDSNFAIVGNTLTAPDSDGHVHTLTWNQIKPKDGSAPKPDSPR
jgi:hypothetical protein